MALWPELRSRTGALLVVAIALSLIRARDQPGVDISFGGTTATVVPLDVAVAALFCIAVAMVVRRRLAIFPVAALAAATVFALLIVVTGAANGAGPFVGGVKVVEL